MTRPLGRSLKDQALSNLTRSAGPGTDGNKPGPAIKNKTVCYKAFEKTQYNGLRAFMPMFVQWYSLSTSFRHGTENKQTPTVIPAQAGIQGVKKEGA